MIINNLKKAILLSIILLISLGSIIYIKQIEINNDLSGNLISDDFLYNFPKADNIILSNNKNKIELVKINNNWKIKNNFYIDENIINSIFKNISNNKLVMKIDDVSKMHKINIIINNKDKTIYDFEIYQNKNNSFIKPKTNNFYWLLSKKINIPKLKKSEFYKQPLHKIDVKEIKELLLFNDNDNITFSRDYYGEKFKLNNQELNSITIPFFAVFAKKITNLTYLDVIDIKSVDFLIFNTQINITTYDGLIITIKLYHNDNNQFVTIEAKLDRIPKNEAIKKAKKINDKYKNWLFKINSNDAKILNSQILLHQKVLKTGG